MRESLFDLCPAGGALGMGVLDFRAAPGTRKGKVRATAGRQLMVEQIDSPVPWVLGRTQP
jgi:hypothetical protein